jgi:1,4-alpha-glucan branching enzyme
MGSGTPLVVATFDAELFGHWWFEGPQWLDFLIRRWLTIRMFFPLFHRWRISIFTLFINMVFPVFPVWGSKGYFDVWCNGKTDWVLTLVYECKDA